MKNIITLAFVLGCFTINAQSVTAIFKDGKAVNTQVSAIGDKQLYTSQGTFNYDDLSAVYFDSEDESLSRFYEKMEASNIQVKFKDVDGVPNVELENVPEEQLSNGQKGTGNFKLSDNQLDYSSQKEIEEIKARMNRFAKQRTTGKGLQLAGVALSTLGVLLTDEEGSSNTIMIGAGGVLSIIGFFVDFGASEHLKIR